MSEQASQPAAPDRRGILRDVCAFGGIGLIAYGAWLAYPPAGFIAPGVLLVALAVGKR